MTQQKSPTLLIILDGYGIAAPSKANAITLAKKPTLDRLFEMYPHTQLGATGADVGLNENQMSGSESGHMNIGAGRIIKQDVCYISESIEDGSFFLNPALTGAINQVLKYGSNFHVMGLMGNGDSPHSNPDHFRALLRLAKKNGVSQVYCHLFTDGRDSFPKSAFIHLKNFQQMMSEERIGKIATLSGRFYSMDRAKNWLRSTKAYDAIVFSRGEKANSPEEAIQSAYESNINDEHLLPTVIMDNNETVARLTKNDSIVFFNLRSDRARQLTKLFVATNKSGIISDNMPVIDRIDNLYFVAMTGFGPDLDVHTAFPDQPLSSTLPMALHELKQLYIAESEKYAHITYFLNGGYSDSVGGEDKVMIPSPLVESYAKIPEMSARVITQNLLDNIGKNAYDFYGINFANADMVGHTGDLKATVKAIEILDKQIEFLAREVLKRKGTMIITADHGNAENMFDFKTNQPNTFHTKNPVPLLIINDTLKGKKIEEGGILGNVAPSIMEILGVEKPRAMEKKSLLS